jgi:hypothetical protein
MSVGSGAGCGSSPASVAALDDAEGMVHNPPSHSLPAGQGLKQPPQCSRSVRVSAHLVMQADKLVSIALQTASLLTQRPLEQALASLQQASPHRGCPPGHTIVGDGPTPVHSPSMHCVPQRLPQKPQLSRSVFVSWQVLPHAVRPSRQETHCPPAQTWPVQLVWQFPQ